MICLSLLQLKKKEEAVSSECVFSSNDVEHRSDSNNNSSDVH